MLDMQPTADQYHACANWNHDRACAIFRQHHFEKNNERQAGMLRDYRRLTQNGDHCRRMAFLLSRKKH